ncbi:MAG: hypothetical protein QGG40_18060, partial [Myxococcota bacterium]|nr:hypothetical protein [Myxococcota bacterium]
MVQPVGEQWCRFGRGLARVLAWVVLGGWSWVADASGTQKASEESEDGAALFEPSDLSGTFMLRLNVATDTVIPVLGRSTVLTEQTMLATIEPTEHGLVQHHDVCGLNAKSESLLARPSFPQAFLDALPTKDYPLQLVRGVDGSWEYAADLEPLYLGWDPTKSETIPREMDDPA